MNFSKLPSNSIVGQFVRLPLRLIPKKMVVPILQGKLKGYKWIVGATDHGCWLGSFEYDKVLLFANKVTPGDVTFDCGAHVGFYSLLASELVGDTGRVYAIEPFSANLKILKRHIDLNKKDNIEVLSIAISNKSGHVFLKEGPTTTIGTSSTVRICKDTGSFKVPVTTIDSIVLEHRIKKLDVIKMDIEGGEYDALLGARTTLEIFKPKIFLSTHGKDVEAKCLDFLRSFGYGITPISEEREFLAE